MIKRNSVVFDKNDNTAHWTPYGRVITIKDGKALVVNVLRELDWYDLDALEEVHYTGRWDKRYLKSYWTLEDRTNEEDHVFYIWHRMSTLRQLKQKAQYYHPEIFKKKH